MVFTNKLNAISAVKKSSRDRTLLSGQRIHKTHHIAQALAAIDREVETFNSSGKHKSSGNNPV
jgi:hypothetical protein